MRRDILISVSQLLHGRKNHITLGHKAYIGWRSQILGTPITLGNYTGIDTLYVVGSQPVSIGSYCALAGELTIITSNHVIDKPNLQALLQNEFHDTMDDGSKGPVNIGHNVWIGRNVTILPGVTIGNGAVIGAGSIVTKSIPDYAIAVGNPARIKRKRFSSKTIKKLQADPWWDWSREKILKNKKFFTKTLS